VGSWRVQRYTELQRAAILKQAVTGKVEEEDSAAVVVADAQADATAYSGAIGQKQRREVVAEIWERVHAAAHLLVGPLLDNGASPDHSGVLMIANSALRDACKPFATRTSLERQMCADWGHY
jgi:hypothetical protein